MPKANCQGGNEEEKGALDKKSAGQGQAHKTELEKQSESEKIGQTRWPDLSKPGRQHERREKAASEKVGKEEVTKSQKFRRLFTPAFV